MTYCMCFCMVAKRNQRSRGNKIEHCSLRHMSVATRFGHSGDRRWGGVGGDFSKERGQLNKRTGERTAYGGRLKMNS